MGLLFVVAAIVIFVLYALVAFVTPADGRLQAILLGVGLACLAAAHLFAIKPL